MLKPLVLILFSVLFERTCFQKKVFQPHLEGNMWENGLS